MPNKIIKVLLVLMFTVFAVFTFAAHTQYLPSANAEVLSAGESATAPKTLYVRNCARCHGADGKSQTELGRTLDAPDLTVNKSSVKRNIQVITGGDGAMPGFGKKLKKADITALANYVRSM